MAGEDRILANGAKHIDFQTEPQRYRHWKLDIDGEVATLTMDVDENGGLFEGYQLKLNSYDLGVDIELADAVQRLRFEHPAVKVVVLRSAKNRGVLRRRQHPHAGGRDPRPQGQFLQVHQRNPQRRWRIRRENSGLRFITVVNGSAAGGGYELALATDHIMLVDDGSSAVALPKCRCWRCCRAPADSPASSTSARCAATTPTTSAPSRKASRASARSTGAWSTRSCRTANWRQRRRARQGIRGGLDAATAAARALRSRR